MRRFIFSFRKTEYFNLQVDLSSFGYGTFLLKQSNPLQTGRERFWMYKDDVNELYCVPLSNTVDSWFLFYNILTPNADPGAGDPVEFSVYFRGEDPWKIIEGLNETDKDKVTSLVITKVDPIPIAKYYNILVDFKGTDAANFGQESFILTLVDTSKTGTDRLWIYDNRIQNDDGTEYINTVKLEKSSQADKVWQMYYLYTFYDGEKAHVTSVWYGYINCENPWEATPDQIISDRNYIPKISGIPVSE